MLDPSHVLTPPPEPAWCPSCGLRHTRREDWLCPRCGKPVESKLPPPKASAAPEGGYPLGSRIAGALLVAGAAALAAVVSRHAAGVPRWPAIAGAVLLAVLGLGAALKQSWARWSAVGAALVAAVVLCEDLLRARLPELGRDPLPLAIRAPVRDVVRPLHLASTALVLAFAAGVVLLLSGRPRRARLAAGVVLAVPLLAALAIRAFAG